MNNGFSQPPINNNQYNMPNNQYANLDNNLNNEKQKDSKKILKLIPKILIPLILILVVIFGKKYIDFKAVDYKSVIDDSLEEYYVSSDTNDLKPIKDLVIEYIDETDIIKNIQTYTYSKVGEWYEYLDEKYVCDINNLMGCKSQLTDFQELNSKLENLYNYKASGKRIILTNGYTSLLDAGTQKVTSLETMVNQSTITNPDNSETIYKTKCSKATDCDCRDGICSCYYTDYDTKIRSEIECYKPETITNK